MRGRILWASVLVVALAAACSKKDSLYIDSSKDAAPSADPAAQKAGEAAARPADEPAPAAEPTSKR